MATNRTGRPPRLADPETAKRLLTAVADGNTRADAASYAGVGRSTFLRWLAEGRRRRKGPYRDFLDAVKKAEAEAVVRHVAVIQEAGKKYWQAAAWWLERRYPDTWSLNRRELRELAREVKAMARERMSGPRPAIVAARTGPAA